MVLGDLGAEIIKVEPPNGESSRTYGPFKNGASAYFNSVNRNKFSFCLDLKTEAGKQVAWDLVKVSDVLVENFRPGTFERLGFGYEAVNKVNSRIVYASISGFGHTGPYQGRPAYDVIIQSMSGVMSITGEPDGPPVRVGTSIADIMAGYQAAIAILSALFARTTSKVGTRVDVAMLDAMLYALENAITRTDVTGEIPHPYGTAHPTLTPFQAFKTKDRHIVVAIGSEPLWKEFCRALVRTDLWEDPDYRTNESRRQNRASLVQALQETFETRTFAHWAEIFEQHELPYAPIFDIAETMCDAQVIARNMIQEIDHPSYGTMKVAGIPFKMGGMSDSIRHPAPTKGEHNLHVLQSILGYSDAAVDKLLSEHTVAS